jgi:hypothetical protein
MLVRAALAFVLCVACSSCRDETPARPNGEDSGDPTDTPADVTGSDGTLPTMETGGLSDSSSDVPPDSPLSLGKWVGLSVFPDCPPSIALDPKVSIPPLTWAACASGRPGCRTLVTTWSSRTDNGPFQRLFPSVQIVDGHSYFMHRRRSAEWNVAVITDGFDGDAVFATAFSPYEPLFCIVNPVVGVAGLGLVGAVNGKSRPAWVDSKVIVGSAPWGSLTKPSLRMADNSEFGVVTESGSVLSIIPGEKTGFAGTYLPHTIQAFDLTKLTPTKGTNVSAYPVPVPDGVLSSDLLTFDLILVRGDATHTVWTSPEVVDGGSRAITWHDFDQTTRADVVWVECTVAGSTATNCSLWTAKYTPSPATVVRRRLGMLPAVPYGGRAMIANAGHVLIVTGKTSAAIYRLSDGVGWNVISEPGTEFAEPVWLSADDAFISTLKPGEQPSSVLRVARSMLGAPTLKL